MGFRNHLPCKYPRKCFAKTDFEKLFAVITFILTLLLWLIIRDKKTNFL